MIIGDSVSESTVTSVWLHCKSPLLISGLDLLQVPFYQEAGSASFHLQHIIYSIVDDDDSVLGDQNCDMFARPHLYMRNIQGHEMHKEWLFTARIGLCVKYTWCTLSYFTLMKGADPPRGGPTYLSWHDRAMLEVFSNILIFKWKFPRSHW